jgi:cell shape-determining protein MreD
LLVTATTSYAAGILMMVGPSAPFTPTISQALLGGLLWAIAFAILIAVPAAVAVAIAFVAIKF